MTTCTCHATITTKDGKHWYAPGERPTDRCSSASGYHTPALDVFPATEGREFTLKVGDEVVPYVVLPKCETGTRGQWRCLTHAEGFITQMDKDRHISKRGYHEMVWVCIEHGPEVP